MPELEALFRREDRARESERAGKVREELETDDVSVEGREEESLAFRWPRSASPRRGCVEFVRPNEGILEPIAGREAETFGSKSASDCALVCDSFCGVQDVRREAVLDKCEGLCAIEVWGCLEPSVA